MSAGIRSVTGRAYQFRPASIKVMQLAFNQLNGERYPGGPAFACRLRLGKPAARGHYGCEPTGADLASVCTLPSAKATTWLPSGIFTRTRIAAGLVSSVVG